MSGPPSGRETWPNFFVAGAPKAGTTALYRFLGQHPDIYLSPIKEPTFFAAGDLLGGAERARVERRRSLEAEALARYLDGPMTEPIHWRMVLEREQYLKLFRDAGNQRAIGEGSVSYFWQPGAPGAIATQLPRARLIFILRDPAERMFSQYLAATYYRPTVSFRDRFQGAMRPGNPWSTWLETGRYATNLRRFFDRFPAGQIRVFLYDEFRTDPGSVLRQVFEFLEIDNHPVETSGRHNEPLVPRFPRLHQIRHRLFGETRPTGPLPLVVRRWIGRVYYRRRRDIRLDPADRQMVVEYFRDEIEQTERIIGRDLAAWRR